MFLQSNITRKAGGQDMVFAFTYRTLAVLAQSTDMDAFDEASPFEQIPMLLFAGLKAGKNQLPEDFTLESMDDFLFTMNPEDIAQVFRHGTEALGFIGQSMKKLVEMAQPPQSPEKAVAKRNKN